MKNFERSDVLSWISDLYKDVYGIRPRGYGFNEWSDAELEAFTDQLIAQLKENEDQERLQEIADVKSFEIQVQNTIDLGAGDRKTALRWLFSSEEYDQGEYVTDWDVDGFLYRKGIGHSDLGQEVKKELLEIYC
tara:strand:+ start:323 stop:724 length:402 start_codon:yes stop_codon:yes gene_type:complete